MPLLAAPAVFCGMSYSRLPFGGSATFLAPVACPDPAVELCCCYLVSCSSSGACGWHCLPCRRLPLGVAAFSDAVCLTYCCAGGVGWAATLPFCYQCFSCAIWLAGVPWVLHPVSGGSHRGCDYSLDNNVVVLVDATGL